MAQQQDNSDFGAKFSTLNVNAMEFVPSFAFSGPVTASATNTTVPTSDTVVAAAAAVTAAENNINSNSVDTTGGAPPPPQSSSSSVTPKSSAPSSLQTTPTAAATPELPPPPATVDPPVQTAAAETAAPIAPAPTPVPISNTPPSIEDNSPLNNDNDPVDSWDVEDEPVSTPEDEDGGDELDDGENDDEIAQKLSKKKAAKIEENKSKKEHVNVVFIGHVDAGKSTIGGQIMALTGMVDKRTLEKNQREAREKSRESWYLSWALDTNSEEREKGKTVEVGRAFFETERKHFTILDAPGHKSFVPNMIGGAAQADLAVLVISARKGEFETGFDRGGQTREHAMLAKTAGVKHLVVLVNKMDDSTVNWDEFRYNECKDKILPYLKKLGFNPNKDLTFMPCSGLTGIGLKDQVDETLCPWYRGLAFIPFIDQLPSLNRKYDGPFIMPIVDKYKDMGTVVMGKVESGCAKKGQNLLVMPNRTQVSVDQLFSDDDEVTSIAPGENVKIKLKGIEEEDVSPGFVLCDASNPIKIGKIFDAQVVILEHKSIICAGYSAVMHIHCAAEEITVKALICLVDKKTGEKSKTRPRFVKQDQVAIMRIECSGLICLEPFKLFPQMGRFTLRDENKTIAIGKLEEAREDSDPVDSWDVEKEPVTTPEDEDGADNDDEDEVEIQKLTKKKPVAAEEEEKSKKEHVNVVFIGHVDAGKSTIGGQIMALTGMVDKRTLEKIQREAREKSRENWYLSWALDTNAEEREEGKTVEIGRAFFETERKHFTILDAPGHKSFVPNMIGGAAQADLAVLVISARKGEFETGFERGGQTREHAMLAKTAGVKHLVVLVNKMDDPTVNWDEKRYSECKDKILPYLKKLGFNPSKDLTFMPCSGLTGIGLKDQADESICPWYRGLAFIPFIDQLPSLNRKLDGPFVMPIADKYKDMGMVVMGKVESGCVKKGQNLMVMPNRTQVSVDQLFSDDNEVTSVTPGENVKIKLKGIDEEDVSPGFVLCDIANPIKIGKTFDAQVVILEHKSIICAGYSAVMHIHCAAEEITVKALLCLVDKKSGEKSKTRPRFVKQDQVAIMRIECSGSICLEPFKEFPQMGRFTLRDENKTIAMGKVLKVID